MGVGSEGVNTVCKILRAILQESEAKLGMKIFNPFSFFVWRYVIMGINKNNHVWIGRLSLPW